MAQAGSHATNASIYSFFTSASSYEHTTAVHASMCPTMPHRPPLLSTCVQKCTRAPLFCFLVPCSHSAVNVPVPCAALVSRLGTQQLGAVSVASLSMSFCTFLFSFLLFLTTPEIAAAVVKGERAEVRACMMCHACQHACTLHGPPACSCMYCAWWGTYVGHASTYR